MRCRFWSNQSLHMGIWVIVSHESVGFEAWLPSLWGSSYGFLGYLAFGLSILDLFAWAQLTERPDNSNWPGLLWLVEPWWCQANKRGKHKWGNLLLQPGCSYYSPAHFVCLLGLAWPTWVKCFLQLQDLKSEAEGDLRWMWTSKPHN